VVKLTSPLAPTPAADCTETDPLADLADAPEVREISPPTASARVLPAFNSMLLPLPSVDVPTSKATPPAIVASPVVKLIDPLAAESDFPVESTISPLTPAVPASADRIDMLPLDVEVPEPDDNDIDPPVPLVDAELSPATNST
jgi:hypothetical protein